MCTIWDFFIFGYLDKCNEKINKCLKTCVSFNAHALHLCFCMCEVCVHCVQYYICLELLTPTDSESLPRGRWRENGKSTRELWIDRKRDDQSDRHRQSKGGEDRQEIKVRKIRMSLNSCTEHAQSPCGLLMRRSWENLWKPLALCHPANWLNIFINFYYMYTRRPAVMNEWPHKQHILVSCGHWLFGSFHCGFFLTLIYSEGSHWRASFLSVFENASTKLQGR